MFTKAIVKKLGESYVKGLTTANLGKPDYEKAKTQHKQYVEALEKCGVETIILEADEAFPDSTFVEDTAILTEDFAVITNPGAESRKGEVEAIEETLKKYYQTLHYIEDPGTLDGGDVLQIEDHFYIGLSSRTNEAGTEQLKHILENSGYLATIVPLKHFFHLKTGIAYLGDGKVLVAGEFIGHEAFKSYEQIVVNEDEEYAANCIRMNDYVIVPKGFEKTKQKIKNAGYSVLEVEMTEFQKQDGGLSCLSLRF